MKDDIRDTELYQILDRWILEQDFGYVQRELKKRKNSHTILWMPLDNRYVETNPRRGKPRRFRPEDPDFLKKIAAYYRRHAAHCKFCKELKRAVNLD